MNKDLMASSEARWFEPALIAACILIFVLLTYALPSPASLLEPDSTGYIEFSIFRTALYPVFVRTLHGAGLSFVQITYVQTAIFCGALAVLLRSMRSAGVPPVLLVAFTVVLGANIYFTSFHRTILTESLVSSVGVFAAAYLIDVLRRGAIKDFAIFSFCCGLIVGLQPATLGILPMVAVTAWAVRVRFRVRPRNLIVAGLLALTAGLAVERVPYHARHGARMESLLPYLLSGKGAMLVRRDTEFSGPHAKALSEIGRELYRRYEPVGPFLAGAPLLALPDLVASYEQISQFQLYRNEWAAAAQSLGIPETELRNEFGRQAILGNIPGFLRLSLIHYFGLWSIVSATFPPTAKALNEYVSRYPDVPMRGDFHESIFKPPAKTTSLIVYPMFMMAGLVTLMMSIMLLFYLAGRPPRIFRSWWVFAAALFSAMCQAHIIFVSLANIAVARYTMAIYPQICLVGVFLVMAVVDFIRQRGIALAGRVF